MAKVKFNPDNNNPVPDFGLGAIPVDKPFEVETSCRGKMHHAYIPKENVGTDLKVQRVIKRDRVDWLRRNWDWDKCNPPQIIHYVGEDGKSRYTIGEGQHTFCADPTSAPYVRVITKEYEDNFTLEANSSMANLMWGIDANFWGAVEKINRGVIEDTNLKLDFIDVLKDFGYKPDNPTKNPSIDLGQKTASLHKKWVDYCLKNVNAMDHLSESKKRKTALRIFGDTIKIMKIYEPNLSKNKFLSEVWEPLFEVLSSGNKYGFACEYEVKHLLKVIKEGKAYMDLNDDPLDFRIQSQADMNKFINIVNAYTSKNSASQGARFIAYKKLYHNMFLKGGILRNLSKDQFELQY